MGSRRMTRSSFPNGRPSNGTDVSGGSRPTGCSYLSNVRPENRSTLCSVMAQLTEETQPSFETTLKSKAVSENCNVKFSCVVTGHPVPQLTWYKDDVQLDRYCGLPKYEIFRNGPNHSLHIFNCALEDAAIYQASASNSKGIVSCSGVLEVGEMNEFKIHQRYFAKIKLKANNKRKEQEGKENQESLRALSPDRTLRKRRSTAEAFLSPPSSTEDEGTEESRQLVAVPSDGASPETTQEVVEEKPVASNHEALPTVSNGQSIGDGGHKTGTGVFGAAQKVFTAHQPKTPFLKKKPRISNSAKSERAKAESPGERASEEKSQKEEAQPVPSRGNTLELMEVENVATSSAAVFPESKNVTGHQRLAKENNNVPVEESNPSLKQRLTAPRPPAVPLSKAEGKQAVTHEREAGRKAAGERLQAPKKTLHVNRTQPQASAATASHGKTKDSVPQAKRGTRMDSEEKSRTSAGAIFGPRVLVKAPREGKSALPQPQGGQSGDQLSEKETDPCPKNVSPSLPARLNEVNPSHAKTNRNDAPVSAERPLRQPAVATQPLQKAPSKGDTSTHQNQATSISSALQPTIKNRTQGARERWKGSNESHTVLFTDPYTSATLSPGSGEKCSRGKVSPCGVQDSQAVTDIKAVKETKVQDETKAERVEVSKPLGQSDSQASLEKVETEAKSVEHTETTAGESTKAGQDGDAVSMNASDKQREEMATSIKTDENATQEFQKNSAMLEKSQKRDRLNGSSFPNFQVEDFKEVQKPVARVESVAELLRMQITALDSVLTHPATTIPSHDNMPPHPTQRPKETCNAPKENGTWRNEVKDSTPDRRNGTVKEDAPAKNLKETLMELYRQIISDQERPETPKEASQAVQASNKANPSTPVANTVLPASAHVSAINCETGSRLENGTSSWLSTQSGPVIQESGSPAAVTPKKLSVQESSNAVLKCDKDEPVQDKDARFMQKIAAEIKPTSETQTQTQEPSPSDLCKLEEDNKEQGSSLSEQKPSTKSETETDAKEKCDGLSQRDNPMVKEHVKIDGVANLTTASSPVLEKRNVASAIPSATAKELASGARRKIQIQMAKPEEASAEASPPDSQTQTKEEFVGSAKLPASPAAVSPSPRQSRRSPLLQPPSEQAPPAERLSPLLSRRKGPPEAGRQQLTQEMDTAKPEGSSGLKDRKDLQDPFKAPQVIRKIRSETFADTSGHAKLWCQFFNILSDSTIKWYRNEVEIAKSEKNAGDENQVSLAIVQASSIDSGVYGCTVANEYGKDSTDCLLSAEILRGMCLREDLGVGEEIEMTPMVFHKGVADAGLWGSKFFGRIMIQESQIGDGCLHKVWRAKVIYGLEPVFESGNTCIIKARNHVAYGGKGDGCLIDRNLEITMQECKIQNLAREYCKIFSAEARVIENFGPTLEVTPRYLMYRPANPVPYATVEANLTGFYRRYSVLDHRGQIETCAGSDVEQKCCALQHWIFLWTSGNMLLTRLEGVDTKITNVEISVKSTGYQGLAVGGNPKVLEHFVSQHRCNYFCGLLSLRSLKATDSLLTTPKPKGSKSPLLQHKVAANPSSPQTGRRAASSPKLPQKIEQEERKTKDCC